MNAANSAGFRKGSDRNNSAFTTLKTPSVRANGDAKRYNREARMPRTFPPKPQCVPAIAFNFNGKLNRKGNREVEH